MKIYEVREISVESHFRYAMVAFERMFKLPEWFGTKHSVDYNLKWTTPEITGVVMLRECRITVFMSYKNYSIDFWVYSNDNLNGSTANVDFTTDNKDMTQTDVEFPHLTNDPVDLGKWLVDAFLNSMDNHLEKNPGRRI